MSAIELEGIQKCFGSVQALGTINLRVDQGEFVSLIGPSGCGKTTLLRIIAGLESPSNGTVRVNGDSPRAASKRHQIGYASQRPALVPPLTALQNVRLTLDVTGARNGLAPEDLLRQFGLGEFLHHYPGQLSGGMQQRVNIAAAVVHHPALLLLDEPFGALDALTRDSMGEWLAKIIAASGQTVVFVTHSVEEAVLLSNRVVVLSARPGKIAECVSIAFSQARTRHLKTDDTFLDEVRRVRALLYQEMNGGDHE